MPNFLERLEIEMEKKTFSFLLVFFIIFLGVDVVSIVMVTLQTVSLIYWYLIPLIVTLLFTGVIIENRKRSWFLLLLIPEGALTLVVAFVSDPIGLAILWIFIGVFSGFTITALLAYFADVTKIEQRGKIAGVITGIAWIVSGILLSWFSSGLFAPTAVAFIVSLAILKLTGAGITIYILFSGSEEKPIPAPESGDQGIMDKILTTFDFLWANSKYRTYLVACFFIFVAQGIFLPSGGAGQIAPQNYQQIASIGFAVGGLVLILSGVVLDKSRKQVIFFGAILSAISFLAFFFPMGAVFLAGFSIVITTIIIILADLAPPNFRARYYSVFLLVSFIGLLIGYWIGLAAMNSPWIVLVCVILTAIGILLIQLFGDESNLEDVSFPATPTPSPIDTTTPTTTPTTEDSSETDDDSHVPPSVVDMDPENP